MAASWKGPITETVGLVLLSFGHILVLATMFGGMLFLHYELLEFGDPKAYDVVPWRYVADTADLGLIVSFIVYGTVSFVVALRHKGGAK